MPTQPRAHPTGTTYTPRSNNLNPQDIADVIDHLAADINGDGNCDLYAGWAVTTPAARLGVAVAVSGSADPVEVIEDLGEDWTFAVGTALDEHPGEVAKVLRAAQAVIHRAVDEVRRRGLAG